MSTRNVTGLALFALAISFGLLSCSPGKKSEKEVKVKVPIDSLLQYLSVDELKEAIGAQNVVERTEGNSFYVDLFPGTDRYATIECKFKGYFTKLTFDTTSIWTSKIGVAPGMTAQEVVNLSKENFGFLKDGDSWFETGKFSKENIRFTITGHQPLFKTYPNATQGHMDAYPKDSIPDFVKVVNVSLFYPTLQEQSAMREFEDKDYPIRKIRRELVTLPWTDQGIDLVTNSYSAKFPLAAFEDKATGNFIVITADMISPYDEPNCKFTFRSYSPTGKMLFKNDTLRTEDPEFDAGVLSGGDPDCEDPVPPVSIYYELTVDANGNVTLDTDFDFTNCDGSINQKNTWKGVIEDGKFKLVEVVRGELVIESKGGGA